MRATSALVAGGVLAWWISSAWGEVWAVVDGRHGGGVRRLDTSPAERARVAWRQVVVIGLAVGALSCARAAEGPAAVGLARRPWRTQATVLAAYLVILLVALTIPQDVVASVGRVWPWLGAHFGVTYACTTAFPLWMVLLHAAYGGVAEEIIVLALAFRALERLPWRDGRTFAATGWATAVLVALRLSYHAYYGLYLLALVPWAYLTVALYRRTRCLLPVVVGHTSFNVLLVLASPLAGGYGLPLTLLALGALCATPLALTAARPAVRGAPPAATGGGPPRTPSPR
ncbi:CPBP family glutamic-type intramembrane protease [Streptoalloteichus tenebrarius]|uniref:CPBP family glutamic-type intramembrane protease n=1 Tax=Streptoalloteichus tenebrarius (strain ATCC 17920 / DSM 40477 / JCM 4838 / CBS 697.72 / NBRC 16177 / NCIMB 11028 / NRRL B-12390 / A12253. 1 / ISP 5477) TaxID=1933 RepID=UPI002646BD6F|nr:CPBP family intramembrane glutamic endopeptidase [Streptoalloteichus tenebrarius]